MSIDTYTKSILTIIAICLLILVFKSTSVKDAYAQSNRVVDINIVKIAGHDVKTSILNGTEGALPITTGVNIIGSTVPIQVSTSNP